jgi:phospholipid transport system substrate-binding protein
LDDSDADQGIIVASMSGSRRTLLRLSLSLIALIATAEAGHAAPPPELAGPVEDLYAALLTAMKAGKTTDFADRFAIIAPTLDRALDLPGILAMSVGPRWSSISAEDRAALAEAFRRFTISSYVVRFDMFNGQRFEVLPDVRTIGDERVLHTRIVRTTGEPRVLDYVMRQEGGRWKVVDVLSDGSISEIAVLRSDFRHILADGGAPALLASLNRKSAELSGGAG